MVRWYAVHSSCVSPRAPPLVTADVVVAIAQFMFDDGQNDQVNVRRAQENFPRKVVVAQCYLVLFLLSSSMKDWTHFLRISRASSQACDGEAFG